MIDKGSATFLFWATTVGAPLYLLVRACVANRAPLADCDEVYNYWEPLHYVLYEGAGRRQYDGAQEETAAQSQQTWEYSHQYALRTYAYLMPLKWIGRLFQTRLKDLLSVVLTATAAPSSWAAAGGNDDDGGSAAMFGGLLVDYPIHPENDELALFVWLRCLLALSTGVAELIWLYSLYVRFSSCPSRHGEVVATWLAVVLLACTGLGHASGALLPSSTFVTAYYLASSALLWELHYLFVVIGVVATLCTGWPFGAMILVPLGIRILYKEFVGKPRAAKSGAGGNGNGGGIAAVFQILGFATVVAAVVQAAVMYVDHHYYGKWVVATFNILQYNARDGDDSLYGTEPVEYYLKNLALNLNVAAVLGPFALIVCAFSAQGKSKDDDDPSSNASCYGHLLTILSPLVPWVMITFPRPHKEERFLFPIYPILCLGAVLVVDATINMIGRVEAAFSRHKQILVRGRILMHAVVWIPFVAVSVSRTAALHKYYTAPLRVYADLSNRVVEMAATTTKQRRKHKKPMTVCTCGEWYRFPSSFFLPNGDLKFGFLPSSFQGQLPQPFSEHGSRKESLDVLQPFNDRNRHEPDRYVQPKDCNWIVDLDSSHDAGCNPAARSHDDWKVVAQYPFLDSERTSTLHRTLYIPYWHEHAIEKGEVKYHQYTLYEVHPSSHSSNQTVSEH